MSVTQQIVREKDSYINKLEMEISEMRKDALDVKQYHYGQHMMGCDLHTIGGDSTTRTTTYNTLLGGG